jgi:hypothetical protein
MTSGGAEHIANTKLDGPAGPHKLRGPARFTPAAAVADRINKSHRSRADHLSVRSTRPRRAAIEPILRPFRLIPDGKAPLRRIWLSRAWTEWRRVLVIVEPATVIGWHRRGAAGPTRRDVRRGVPRSTDGGATCQPTIDVDSDVHEVRAHPKRPGVVMAAGLSRLWLLKTRTH